MSEENKTQSKLTFGSFGTAFQEKAFQALLVDPAWGEQVLEVFDESYFDLKSLQFLAGKYFAFAKKYKVFPSLPILLTIIKDDLRATADAPLKNQIVEYLSRMRANPSPGDLQFVKDKALEFCRKQALKQALEAAVDQIQAEKYESIVETIKKAVMVGTAPQIGHDFFNDFEARFIRLNRNCVPTGLPELDKKGILSGGLGRGELASIVACTGVGKSHFLVMLGCNALLAGKNVLHYTLELSEESTGVRYDSNLCEINSDDCIDSKDKIMSKYKDMKGLGKLFIKYFPANSATIYTLRAHVERLSLKGFRPDVIIIDYADKMRSTRQYDSPRFELKLIYEELRAYACELGIPLWTASQSNKEGSNSDIVDLNNMSEAYGKAAECDVVLSISRKSHEKAGGWGRLYVAKNRAGRDGLVYPIKIDTAQSRFVITGEAGGLEETRTDDEEALKKALRLKWKELKNDPMLDKAITSDDKTV